MALLLGTLFVPRAAFAWDTLGHKTIAVIAENRLSKPAQKAVAGILGPGVALADIAGCPDAIKRRSIQCASFPVKMNKRTSAWHFIDLPISATPTAADFPKYCRNHGHDDQCAPAQIRDSLKVLKDPKASQYDKQLALMFVVHLVGDLTQPLHNADDDDAGGNAKLVRYFAGSRSHKKTNLHHIWDNMLMKDSEVKKTKSEALAAKLERAITPKKEEAWEQGDVIDGTVLESFTIAKTKIYPSYAVGNRDLGLAYRIEMQPIAFEQVERAGVLLSFLLNQVWP